MLQVQIQDWKVHVNHMLFLSYGRDIKPRTPVNLLFKVALLLNFEENSTSPFYFEVAFLLNFKENFTSSSYLKSPSYQILRKIPHRPLIQSRPLIKFRGKFHVALLFEVTLLFERWEYPYFSWKVRYINTVKVAKMADFSIHQIFSSLSILDWAVNLARYWCIRPQIWPEIQSMSMLWVHFWTSE